MIGLLTTLILSFNPKEAITKFCGKWSIDHIEFTHDISPTGQKIPEPVKNFIQNSMYKEVEIKEKELIVHGYEKKNTERTKFSEEDLHLSGDTLIISKENSNLKLLEFDPGKKMEIIGEGMIFYLER